MNIKWKPHSTNGLRWSSGNMEAIIAHQIEVDLETRQPRSIWYWIVNRLEGKIRRKVAEGTSATREAAEHEVKRTLNEA